MAVGQRKLPKLTPDRIVFLQRRIKRLQREMLLAFVLGVVLAATAGYAAILWERSVNPRDVGFAPAIGDITGLLVAAPFMTALLMLRNRVKACLEELNPTKKLGSPSSKAASREEGQRRGRP